jgi:hypothetical protein
MKVQNGDYLARSFVKERTVCYLVVNNPRVLPSLTGAQPLASS